MGVAGLFQAGRQRSSVPGRRRPGRRLVVGSPARQAHAIRQAGFTAVWLPPVWKGASGIQSVGYDPFDDYDLGSKDQRGTIPTRYGTREQLARCLAMPRANDLDVYVDLVEHHRGGGTGHEGKTFRCVDAEGRPGGGRFPKDATCFHGPDIPQDPHVFEDQSFGSGLAPIHDTPPGYVFGGLLASADWLTQALDIQGFRLDFVSQSLCCPVPGSNVSRG